MIRRLLLLSLLLFVSCGQSGPREKRYAFQEDMATKVIVAFGDSLTAGYGLPEDESYPAILQTKLDQAGYDYRVVNAGVSGDTSAGAFERIDWVLKQEPAIVIVAIGANDGLRGLSTAEAEKNLRMIISKIQLSDAQVILGGMKLPPNYGFDYAQEFADMYESIAKDLDIALIPFFLAGVATKPELNISDGIHPNQAGYEIIVNENIWPVLEEYLY